jgi:hypothetical protein
MKSLVNQTKDIKIQVGLKYYNMKVALVCVAKWEDHYLEEWLDYNHKIGFDKIIMYQNDWRTDIERPFLEKRICDGRSIQVGLYNHHLSIDKEYDWIAFFDCDEFLVLKKHNNVKEFIEEYGSKHPVLSFNWHMFGNLNKKERTSNSLIKEFTKRGEHPDQHIKVMVKVDNCAPFQLPHNLILPSMDTNGRIFHGPFNKMGPTDVAYLNHYHNKTREDWMDRCRRGRIDCDIAHDEHRWDNEVNINNEVEDMWAYNFLYGN